MFKAFARRLLAAALEGTARSPRAPQQLPAASRLPRSHPREVDETPAAPVKRSPARPAQPPAERPRCPHFTIDQRIGFVMGGQPQVARLMEMSGADARHESHHTARAGTMVSLMLQVGETARTLPARVLGAQVEGPHLCLSCQLVKLTPLERAHLLAYLDLHATTVRGVTASLEFEVPDRCLVLVNRP